MQRGRVNGAPNTNSSNCGYVIFPLISRWNAPAAPKNICGGAKCWSVLHDLLASFFFCTGSFLSAFLFISNYRANAMSSNSLSLCLSFKPLMHSVMFNYYLLGDYLSVILFFPGCCATKMSFVVSRIIFSNSMNMSYYSIIIIIILYYYIIIIEWFKSNNPRIKVVSIKVL